MPSFARTRARNPRAPALPPTSYWDDSPLAAAEPTPAPRARAPREGAGVAMGERPIRRFHTKPRETELTGNDLRPFAAETPTTQMSRRHPAFQFAEIGQPARERLSPAPPRKQMSAGADVKYEVSECGTRGLTSTLTIVRCAVKGYVRLALSCGKTRTAPIRNRGSLRDLAEGARAPKPVHEPSRRARGTIPANGELHGTRNAQPDA